MAATIDKYITTKSDFDAGIIKFIMTPDWQDGAITMKQDRTDDKLVSTILHATFFGTSTIIEGAMFINSKIEIIRNHFNGNGAYIESDILPSEYEIKLNFKSTIKESNPLSCIAGIGKFAYNPKICFHITLAGNYVIFYFDAGIGALKYWNGAAWGGYTHCGAASANGGVCKIIKDATNYTLELYEAGVLFTSAPIAIANVNNNTVQDHFMSGDTWFGLDCYYQFTIWDIYGIYIDRYAEKPGAFSAILDLGSRPIIPGSYVEVYNQNYWDEELPQEKINAGIYLRDAAARTYISQGFKLTKDGIVDKIRLHLYEVGAITAGKKVWIEIWTDDGAGKPNAIISGYTSSLVEATTIMSGKTEYTYTEFSFSSATIPLTNNTQYHFVVKADYAINGTDYLYVGEEYVGSYAKGVEGNWSGAAWTMRAGYDLIFGIKLVETQLITRKISYANTADYKTLNSKADFEGNNEVQSQIDTATEAGAVLLAINAAPFYHASGYIQNDIDLGVVPAYFCTFSADYYLQQTSTTLTFKVATSDDNIAWTGFTTLTMTQGYSDLTALGKHRYWRVKIEFATTDAYYTAKLYSWTIDFFPPLASFSTRDKIQAYRYLKLYWEFESNNPLTSIELTEIFLSFLIAYELYIKRVKYKISASGITADMELSSQ